MVSEAGEGGLGQTRSFKVLTPGTVISHYKIIEKIGEGGMGVVYKAEDTRLDRTVALKFLPPHLLCDAEARERFEHEAKAASALNHPNIATIYEIDEVEGRCFIAMEYLEGGSLKGLLKAKDLTLKEILDLAIQLGEGLAAAHERGVVHRDIKPDNIMLTGKGLPKIMDFGLAKLKGASKVTKTGTTLGTLHYMSPEQAQGREVDRRSDIFSFGVILYEMVTGRLPFRGEYEAAVIHSILNETPEPMARYKAGVPEGLQRVVDKALAKDLRERYQHADEMVADLAHERRLLETGRSEATQVRAARPASRKRFLPIVIPAAVAAVVILSIFVFEPFRVELGPGREAAAQKNSLAIMYFENLADPEDQGRFAEMITALLITDLSESQYMRVVSRQRLYDILNLLGKADLKVIDKSVASAVAERAGVKWILTGSILKTEPNIVLTSDISDASAGDILATQRIMGDAGEDLFAVVDKLSAQIRGDLSLPAEARTEEDQPVADVTTHSPEAYRLYLEGLDYGMKYYELEAEESLRKALEVDSTFAMAYVQLAWFTDSPQEKKDLVAKAVEYSDKVSWKERQYIKSWEARLSGKPEEAIQEALKITERYPDEKDAYSWVASVYYANLVQYEEAVHYYTKAVEIDPLYKEGYNSLAYVYSDMGDLDKSIWAINKYIALAPEEANPYDSRAELYARSGNLDEAIESYKKALEIKPDFSSSWAGLGHMYLFKREYEEAERCYQKLCTSADKDTRSEGRAYLAYIPLYQGKFEDCLRLLEEGLAADRMEQAQGWWNISKLCVRSDIYRQRNPKSALEEWETLLKSVESVYPDQMHLWQLLHIQLLAENNEIAKAESVAEALKTSVEGSDESQMVWYWSAAGSIELAKGNLDGAITEFERVARGVPVFWARYQLAEAYLESGRLEDAVTEFEEALSQYYEVRAYHGIKAVKAYYLLGLAYEQSGWKRKALEQYEEFLDIWKDADPGIPEIEDARRRLAALRRAS